MRGTWEGPSKPSQSVWSYSLPCPSFLSPDILTDLPEIYILGIVAASDFWVNDRVGTGVNRFHAGHGFSLNHSLCCL